MVDEAERRTQERTAIGRHLAVVLLDGACEYAMGLAIAELGVPLSPNPRGDSFQARYNVLIGSPIGAVWAAGSWKGVSEQRGSRNRAQHDGTSVDADDLIRWSIDTENFITSLCRAVYKVELREIKLAEGILSPNIRASLIDAETALSARDPERAFVSAMAGFDEARGYWRTQRADAHGPPYPFVATTGSLGGIDWSYGTAQADPIQEFVEVQPFAPDIGEYFWLLTRRGVFQQSGPAEIPLETAARAFRFVYFWILRWEAFAIRYEWRPLAGDEPYEPPRTGRDDARPSLSDIVEVEGNRPYADQEPVFTIGLRIADIPDTDREHWAAFVRQALNESAPSDDTGLQKYYASVTEDGRINLSQIKGDPDTDEIVALATSAITKAQDEFELYIAARDTWTGQHEQLVQPYSDALRSVAFRTGQPLLSTVTARGLPHDFTVNAALAISVDEWTQHDALVSISRLFPGVPDRPVAYENGTLSFKNSLSPAQAGQHAQEIASDWLAARSNRADRQAELDSTRGRIQDGLRQAIARDREREP